MVLLRSWISTRASSSSSEACPENVIGWPGVTWTVCAEVGGVMTAGAATVTVRGDGVAVHQPRAVGGVEGGLPVGVAGTRHGSSTRPRREP